MELTAATLVRLTRDAEVESDDDDNSSEELSELVREQVRQRRYEPVVRLEFGPGANPAIKEMLRDRFELCHADVYDLPDEVDYTTLFEIAGLPVPELRDPAWAPLPVSGLEGGATNIFSTIKAGDFLLHHPYDSFDASVEHFISAAADDPQAVINWKIPRSSKHCAKHRWLRCGSIWLSGAFGAFAQV
jgi:polyphosphate kinase